ncbi:MAG: extracellular solute-binding protein, partial [Anaerolineales bacterium]|nr:extracellular solute-binding protein [Anaerolineales bacterium]
MNKTENYNQRKTFLRMVFGLFILAFLLIGISSCNFPDLRSYIPSFLPTEIPGAAIVPPTPRPSATTNVPVLQSQTLIIWVPPQFDLADGSTADNLFLSRLDEFLSRRPQVEIQVRVKSLSGEFGLLDSLQVTGSAAPIILPDLIALPRPLLEQAFMEGLVLPLDDYTDTIAGNDWFNYALDLALVDEQIAGIPFAGDLMVLAYKNDTGETPPPDWKAVLQTQKALAFPASDSRGLVTLALYQSLAGDLVDADNQPFLQEDAMLEVLSYYQQAQAANVMPYWLTQFETDQQAWQSYQDRQSTLAITWSSILLGSESPNTSMASIPTQDEKPFSYADGWVWCVIPSDLETEKVAVELAEFLTEASYLSTWGIEAGYLPVRPSGLESWTETSNFATLQQLLPSAVLLPGEELLIKLGPVIRDAVVGVLKDQIEPQTALE